jgi:hypothetical protein
MFFENIYSSSGYGLDESLPVLTKEQQDFIFNQLILFSRRVAKSKNDNLLCGPFIQDPKNPGRKKENIQSLFGQFLDFDTTRWMFISKEFPEKVVGVQSNGHHHYINDPILKARLESGTAWELEVQTPEGIVKQDVKVQSPLVFEALTPITIQDIQAVIGTETRVLLHSTFSGGNKRRAFMLYDRLVTPDEHEKIARDIYAKIVKQHPHCQMDWTCTRSNSLFYLPCSAIDKDTLIEVSGTDAFEVDEWLLMGMSIPTIPGPEVPEIKDAVEETETLCSDTQDQFKIRVEPFLNQMAPGNRFVPAQKAVVACKKIGGDSRRLFREISARGLDPARTKSMLGWFERL